MDYCRESDAHDASHVCEEEGLSPTILMKNESVLILMRGRVSKANKACTGASLHGGKR